MFLHQFVHMTPRRGSFLVVVSKNGDKLHTAMGFSIPLSVPHVNLSLSTFLARFLPILFTGDVMFYVYGM